MRDYKIRINVRPLRGYAGKLYAFVSLSDETRALFDKPYVSVKRMQDRLAFVPWDNKTEGRGTVAVGCNTLQFGLQTDCEKMQDFCGEYDLVNKTDAGVVFVKLADRKPFTIEFEKAESKRGKVADAVAEDLVPAAGEPQQFVGVPTLKELLGKKIEEGQAKLDEINTEIDRLNKQYIEPLINQADEIDKELRAFCKAYNCLKDGE